MEMLVQILTKADTRLWLQRMYEQCDQDQEPGLRAAIAEVLSYYYPVDVIGSVACASESFCIRKGVCELSSSGNTSLEAMKRRVEKSAEVHAQADMQNKFNEFADRVTTTRLRNADLGQYEETDVVTTILPMCSVCWGVGALHLDHIVPKSKGGLNDYTNYQLLCGPCNSSKSDRDMDVWHEWVNTSEDEGAVRIRERRSKNRSQTLPKGEEE